MKRSSQCPECRDKVKGIRRNHAIVSLVESYIEANPSRKRSEEELKEMDAKNAITDEMVPIE